MERHAHIKDEQTHRQINRQGSRGDTRERENTRNNLRHGRDIFKLENVNEELLYVLSEVEYGM